MELKAASVPPLYCRVVQCTVGFRGVQGSAVQYPSPCNALMGDSLHYPPSSTALHPALCTVLPCTLHTAPCTVLHPLVFNTMVSLYYTNVMLIPCTYCTVVQVRLLRPCTSPHHSHINQTEDTLDFGHSCSLLYA